MDRHTVQKRLDRPDQMSRNVACRSPAKSAPHRWKANGVAILEKINRARSDLPVSFLVLDEPASLSGNMLSFTGLGTVTVQALQGEGMNNGVYCQATPSVSRTLQINAPFTIIRLRFNSPAIVNGIPTGNMTLDAQNIGRSAAGKGQTSFIWTDPSGLWNSTWPTFNNPAAVSVGNSPLVLPSIPAAAQGQTNSIPTGGA